MIVRLSALTNVGVVRDHNEDNFSVIQSVSPFEAWDYQSEGFETPENGILLMVADGMGGANAGEIASSIVVGTVENSFKELAQIPQSDKDKEEFLKKTIVKSKKEIVKEAKSNIEYQGMGTTVVIAWVISQKCFLAWAGDSRAYLLSKGKSVQIVSRDHSLVWELMEKGMLTEEEAETHPDSNIITQSLSDSGSKLKPDSKTIDINEGDKLLLCSDGLNGMVSKNIISNILSQNQGEEACKKLVNEANTNGGTDNITVVLMETSPFWKEEVKTVITEEDEYEPITEKTVKVKVIDEVDDSDKQDTASQEVKTDIQVDSDGEKPKSGFFKKLWSKLVNPEEIASTPETESNEVTETETEDSEDVKSKGDIETKNQNEK